MDEDLRGRLLKHFFGLRNANDGSVGVSEIIFSPAVVPRQAIALACEHMDEVRWIKWMPLTGANEGHIIGRAKILGYGVDVVKGKRAPDIAVHFPDSGHTTPEASAPVPKEVEAQSSEPESPPQAASASAARKPAELITLKPTFMGMSIDLKELWWRFRAWLAKEQLLK
jgi:hypothetical protein